MTISNENLLKFQSTLLTVNKPKSEMTEKDCDNESEEESEKCAKPSESVNLKPK